MTEGLWAKVSSMRAGRAGVDEDLGDLGEVERIVAEGEHFAGAAWALVPEAEVEHRVLAAVFHDVRVRGEAAVAGVGRGRGSDRAADL